ncbi:NT5C3B isoform 2 [Pan troglodytes]|uniref:5'-nucleotidase, cytosolic IIIB n=5 Tax=Hominidae TaxID=9604 RepID=E5RH64_HUMAN|nr:5'-nucleotidase, cytosolic IIIB [Homo sapiens]KAI4049482.1 5'-nucleotidase, cytosolic IIIB [Homo sapiens]PNI33991.1 NT5C3B isoform 2 [Pan troglodytes]PNJ07231.1 NT5C3B isoform 2 [Pongo abelii]
MAEEVISDFDMTLSRFAYNGKRCPSSYNILDNSKIISEECRKELTALLHHYYPIEIDPHRTVKEKLPHMVEWWTKAHNLLCQQKIQKFQIAQVVRESNAMLREGYKTFFNTLYHNNIPLFIFSAGIGDILEEIIRQMKVFHPNIHIVSNYMDFNEDVEERRERYMDSYDIVLEKDETLDVVNGLLQHILCQGVQLEMQGP